MPKHYNIICKNCGKHVRSTGVNYCNVGCKKEHTVKRHTHKCVICGKVFVGRQKGEANRYCSRGCLYKDKGFLKSNFLSNKKIEKYIKSGGWMKGKENMGFGFKKGNVPKNKGKFKTVTFTCLNCGVLATVQDYRQRKYCSFKCRTKHWKGKNSPSYKPESYIHKHCLSCGNSFITRPKYTNKGCGLFCSHKCSSDYRSGERNPAWEGGKSFEPYPPTFNSQLKDKIRARDNYKCQICGIPELECNTKLTVHHIDYDKNNCKEENLISLCNICHLKTNTNREYWKDYFNKLQEVS